MKRLAAVLVSLLALAWALPARAQPPAPHHAGLVVVHGTGDVVTRCVAFDEPAIFGLELLRRAELAPVVDAGGLGAAVCALDGAGCPATDCFCECKGTPCTYWTYYRRVAGDAWAYAGLGASSTQVRDGDVEGWVWGTGTEPPALDFAALCPDATLSVEPLTPATPLPADAPSDSGVGNYGIFVLLAGGLIALALFHHLRRR